MCIIDDAEGSYHMLPLSVASQLNLQPVKLEVYHSLHVEYDCELREYYVKKTKKTFRRGCVFFEFDNDRENITEEMHLLFLEKVRLVIYLLNFLFTQY